MNIYAKKKEPVVPRTFAQAIAEDMKDVQDEIINEAVEHLIGSRSREIEDEPRYLIGKVELVRFKKKYFRKMAEYERKGLEYTHYRDLHIGIVEELSYHDSPYFEVSRQKYYDKYPEYFFGN